MHVTVAVFPLLVRTHAGVEELGNLRLCEAIGRPERGDLGGSG